ncbi:MAG: undecaprenyl-diphosphatase [Gammaproteobacteria bacterium]|jgi:undecaprenyl-diphosphatase|tara:strand:+ start:7407 stop:8198 length:792 start_codon:yes stop_codon:yes gene_type:complete
MSEFLLSLILGLIQGLTEFLPVSSSAHLLFPTLIFGSDDLGLPFDIAVHAGTLVAVIFFFRSDLINMTKSFFVKSDLLSSHKRLALLLILSTIPVVIVGFFASDLIGQRIFSIQSIAWMNLIFAFLLLLAYKLNTHSKQLVALTITGALFIGCFQVFALLPGASRSGTAITAALFIGLSLKDASKFSFMLGIPTILGALVFLLLDLVNSDINLNILSLITGFLISMFFAFFTIKYFLLFAERIGMYPFVIYRLGLGAVLLLLI